MVGRRLFKTKLCVLYQRGHCTRQNCSFAHGSAELRQVSGSYNGTVIVHCYVTHFVPWDDKRDYRDGDLRDKLDKKISPRRRYSPGRGVRGRRAFRGSSPSSSLDKNSGRKRRKKQHFDGQNDFSLDLGISDVAEDQTKERKATSDSKIVLEEQLKEVQSEVNVLDHRKSQLRMLVDEKAEEADSLSSRIKELDAQLSKEKEEHKRITSKIKKFVKAHERHVRVQDELKRSQDRLQKLGDQLGSSTTTGAIEEDSSINIISDGETAGYQTIDPTNVAQNNSSHSKKVRIRQEVEAGNNRRGGNRPAGNEGKQKRGKNVSASISSVDKMKGSGSGVIVPSTSMAAHAIDELVEIDVEENIDAVETASIGFDKGVVTYEFRRLPISLPPPPPLPRHTYSQCEGEEEHVDVDRLEEEMVDVDIV